MPTERHPPTRLLSKHDVYTPPQKRTAAMASPTSSEHDDLTQNIHDLRAKHEDFQTELRRRQDEADERQLATTTVLEELLKLLKVQGNGGNNNENGRNNDLNREPGSGVNSTRRRTQEIRIEKFSGAKEGPSWYTWVTTIQNKLKVNHDHFESQDARMLCVFSHTTGTAQEHLLPRYEDASPARFCDAEEMISYLETIYGNAFKQRDAQYQLSKLVQEDKETFSDFQSRFMKLAQESRTPVNSDLVTSLYDKLSPPFRNAVLSRYVPGMSYQSFVSSAAFIDEETRRNTRDLQKLLSNVRTPGGYPAPRVNPAMIRKPASDQPAAGLLTFPTHSPITANTAKGPKSDPTMLCYNCAKAGHMARDCPLPKRQISVHEISQMEYMLSGKEGGMDVEATQEESHEQSEN